MPENRNKIEAYVDEACAQVRWKRAKEGLAMELRTHLLDQKDACLAEGMTEEEAQAESVRQMGDPVEVGTQLDRVHRPKPQWDLMLLVFGLVVIGLVLQGVLMMEVPYDDVGRVYEMRRSAAGAVLGGALMLGIYWLDYTILGRRAPWVCGLWAGVAAISIPFSHRINGRLYNIYYLLLLAPVCIALLVYGMRGKGWKGLLIGWVGIGIFAIEGAVVASFSMIMLIVFTGSLLILAAVWRGWLGVPKRAATGWTLALSLGPILWMLIDSAYLTDRLAIALHPELDPMGKGFMAIVLRKLLREARWMGRGDTAPWKIPNAYDDHFLTWVIHLLGWAAGLALVAALVLLLAVALRRCFRQKGMLGFLLSLAAVLILGMEAAGYVIYNLGFGFFGVLALPFLSYGGRYMVVNLALAGLLMSVFREERLPQAQKRETPRLRRKWITLREDGAVVILPPWVKKAAQ